MSYFSAENLVKTFSDITIEASLQCEKGSMTAIVGPSGSGKSTVLRMICGLEESSNSESHKNSPKKIILDGADISELAPAKRKIGMVFQNHALFEHLKVEDNVAYGLVSQGMRKKEARKQASEFLKNFGLEGYEKRFPQTLSGGEAQRVCLARTLIVKPKLVLFDEPLSALDAPLRKKLAAMIRQLQAEFGFTGIMVTHDIEEAKSISDRIILMSKGKITWQGDSQHFSEEMLYI